MFEIAVMIGVLVLLVVMLQKKKKKKPEFEPILL